MSTVPATRGREPRHGLRIFLIWGALTVVIDPIFYWVVGPHVPPIRISSSSGAQHAVIITMAAGAIPVVLFVWTYLAYAVIVWRRQPGDAGEAVPLRGNARVQVVWIAISSFLVLALAVTGTIDLFANAGAGAGEGSNPLNKPANVGKALQVQVIAQQWEFTFRYPGYGGVETARLELPVGRQVEFHVTSLDVIHSFWAIELGVKADAVPGADNIAFTRPYVTTHFQIRCAELCGLWHGHMNGVGYVVSDSAFTKWITHEQKALAPVTAQLPPYSTVYYPEPSRNG